ncbi:MAG: IS1 family transposase [Anaerolineae bacterium]|nr:IS1 family transposase [Anaerolineae bacterium]
MDIAPITCPYCRQTDRQVKAGRNASGSQRYKCQHCQRKYTPNPSPRGHSDELHRQALQSMWMG